MEGRNGALLTLTYLGAERAVPSYNTMGLAKASLEASVRYWRRASARAASGQRHLRRPDQDTGAAGIKASRNLLRGGEHRAARRNVTIEDVGNVAAFLLSDSPPA